MALTIDASTAAYDQTAVSINMTGGTFGKGASLESGASCFIYDKWYGQI